MSLFYLLEHVRKHHDVIVYFLAPGPAVDFYRSRGIPARVAKNWSKIPHCNAQYQTLNPFTLKFYRDLKTYGIQFLRSFLTYRDVKRVLRQEQPDLVHLNSSVLLIEGLAVKALGLPLVWHIREYLEYGVLGLRLGVVRRIILGCANEVVVLSKAEGARLGKSDKIHVIPNFIDLDKFNIEHTQPVGLRQRFGLPPTAPIFAMLGWSLPVKGTTVAVEALRLVQNKHPGAKLILFGTGAPPEGHAGNRGYGVYRRVQALSQELDLKQSVIFAGTVFDIANHINEIDIVLVPFVVPHFARPILEAGAMRKVVVTSDLEGTREMVLDGTAGFMAQPGNADDLAAKMIQALEKDNSEKTERMYQNVLANYNATKNAEATIDLYRFNALPSMEQLSESCE
jgi:glycosyltransferase involved in cell wall biosynthesis